MSTILRSISHTKPRVIDDRAAVTIREATADDRPGLERLAELDSAEVPSGRLLLGEVDGELRAAAAIAGGRAIADPFHRTTELVDLLRARSRQMPGVARGSLRVIDRSPSLGRRLHRQAA
jgi:hypothetical protein